MDIAEWGSGDVEVQLVSRSHEFGSGKIGVPGASHQSLHVYLFESGQFKRMFHINETESQHQQLWQLIDDKDFSSALEHIDRHNPGFRAFLCASPHLNAAEMASVAGAAIEAGLPVLGSVRRRPGL